MEIYCFYIYLKSMLSTADFKTKQSHKEKKVEGKH